METNEKENIIKVSFQNLADIGCPLERSFHCSSFELGSSEFQAACKTKILDSNHLHSSGLQLSRFENYENSTSKTQFHGQGSCKISSKTCNSINKHKNMTYSQFFCIKILLIPKLNLKFHELDIYQTLLSFSFDHEIKVSKLVKITRYAKIEFKFMKD